MSEPFCAQCGMEIERHECIKPPKKKSPVHDYKALAEQLAAALKKIVGHNCGCTPICRCFGTISDFQIWRDWVLEEAGAALAAAKERGIG